MIEIPVSSILSSIVAISAVIAVVLLARRASERIEEVSKRRIAMEQEIDVLSFNLKDCEEIIKIKDREIESLKSKLDEKEEEITNLKEAIKSAEKIYERDIERIRDDIEEILARMREIVKEEEKRDKKK